MARFQPVPHDRDTGGLFEAAAEGRLVIRACKACGSALHPPVAYCRYCASWDTDWRDVEGRARLYAWTTVTHQVHPDYPTPYTVVLVELEAVTPVVRMVGYIDGVPDLRAGMAMEAYFAASGDGQRLPQWRPVP
jgi:uncharacterized OB-fold protein